MENDKTIFDYMGQILMVYGFSILCLNVFALLFGESAKGYSSMFAYGNEGLSIVTMLQYLLMAAVIITLRFVFFTDKLIKQMSMVWRIICMFASVFVSIMAFIIGFDWFPVNDLLPWIMFVLCFGISTVASTLVCIFKEKLENKKLEQALMKMKKEGM